MSASVPQAMLSFYMFRSFWDKAESLSSRFGFQPNELLVSSLFMLLMNIFNTVMTLPLKVFDTFVVEEKHGFNKQVKITK